MPTKNWKATRKKNISTRNRTDHQRLQAKGMVREWNSWSAVVPCRASAKGMQSFIRFRAVLFGTQALRASPSSDIHDCCQRLPSLTHTILRNAGQTCCAHSGFSHDRKNIFRTSLQRMRGVMRSGPSHRGMAGANSLCGRRVSERIPAPETVVSRPRKHDFWNRPSRSVTCERNFRHAYLQGRFCKVFLSR